MFFFPYRVNLPLGRIPVLTIFIVILCLVIYFQQYTSKQAIESTFQSYCQQQTDRDFRITLKKLLGKQLRNCEQVLYAIHSADDPDERIEQLSFIARKVNGFSPQNSRRFIADTLEKKYQEFSLIVPSNMDKKLAYQPGSFNLIRMITSQFAHADLGHLIGNLLFFVAFAASVEIVLGSFYYFFIFIGISFITSISYSISTISDTYALPTIGLSGVVMGMIGLFIYLMPTARIRCLFIFILYFRVFLLPAWLLAAWYVGWDMYSLFFTQLQTNVNLVAHVSGAIGGYIIGVIFFRKTKQMIKPQLKKMIY